MEILSSETRITGLWFAFFFVSAVHVAPVVADQSERLVEHRVVSLSGETMGTTYSVKVIAADQVDLQDLAIEIDRELRSVNDQMSTYLEASEISQFNASQSVDWFPVSPDTAQVVSYALEVSAKTDGAFDITVGPLVDAWSFGAATRTRRVPPDERLAKIRQTIGYEKVKSRLDPPALRKTEPSVQIDLSAIAKGHGVDRIVDLLLSQGIENMFVEIGGEVRTVGKKPSGDWMVGIQNPSTSANSVAIALPLSDGAVATSGDYRNFFEIDGVRYSHTIDPRTGKPVTHSLAQVSVRAASCMAADAWATAINVLGPDAGALAATKNELSVLLFVRDGDLMSTVSQGEFPPIPPIDVSPQPAKSEIAMLQQIIPLALMTAVILGIVLLGMAVGVLFGRKAIGGSCGGLASKQNEDGSTSCSLCSKPSDACKELRDKMSTEASS